MTNAAVMTMTSGPRRTHPITRGAWLATVIFNDPPPPPPADVPPLPEDKKDTSHLTIRERLAAHRQRADCAGCHEQIDPLGFALENDGPTGLWRTAYDNERDIDMSGKLFGQHKFASVVEFKDAILQNKHRSAGRSPAICWPSPWPARSMPPTPWCWTALSSRRRPTTTG